MNDKVSFVEKLNPFSSLPLSRFVVLTLFLSHPFYFSDEILDSYAEVDTLLYSTFPSQVLHSFSRHHPKQPTRYGALESRTVSRAHSVLEPDESNHHRYGEEEEGLLSGKELGKEEKDRRKDRKERVMLNGSS